MDPKKYFLAFMLLGLMSPVRGQDIDKYINPTVFVDIAHAPKLNRRPGQIQITASTQPDFDRRFVLAMDRLVQQRGELGSPITVLQAPPLNKDLGLLEKTSESEGVARAISPKSNDLSVLLTINPEEISVSEDSTLDAKLNAGVSIFDKFKKIVKWSQSISATKPSNKIIFFYISVKDLASGQVLLSQSVNTQLDGSVPRSSNTKTPSPLTDPQIETLAKTVISLLMGWTERQSFLYYDDRNYGMSLSYKLMSIGDFAGAKAQSLLNLVENEKDPAITPKDLGKLHYNHAITLLTTREFSEAVNHLRESVRLDPASEIYLQTLQKGINYEKYARE